LARREGFESQRQIRRLVVNVMAGQVGVLSLVSYQTSGMVLTRRLP
jgi:hypothetical protein